MRTLFFISMETGWLLESTFSIIRLYRDQKVYSLVKRLILVRKLKNMAFWESNNVRKL